jgi:hypothetical protein
VIRSLALLALAVAVLAASPAPRQPPRPIGIVINGDTLAIDPPPRFEKNILYVPVRRTIEALGLTFNRSGNRIQTQIGSRTASFTVGRRDVQLDASTVALAGAPIQIKDVLYVPLRFFTDVLGAQARFDRRSNTVTIVAQLVGRTTNGFETVGTGYARFGTVAGVDVLSDPPTLTIESNGIVKTIRVADNATIEVHDVNVDVTSPGELRDVRPGDFARVEMRKDGRVQRVIDEYGSRNGRIVAIAGSQFVLGDGQVISVGRTTEVSLNGKAAQFDNLRPGDEISVRYNVETNEVREVLAGRRVASSGGQVAIDSVDSDARRPLRPGDVIHVTMHATPNGSASFDIGSDIANQAMVQRSPGFYVGSYTIPRGANFRDVVLIGRLNAAGEVAQQAAADAISASSTPPGIADFAPDENATINTNRPAVYASFASDAVDVNPASALLWIDGRDVTSECVRTNAFIQYLPSYAYRDGLVHVTVRVSDEAGNTTTKSWTFTIRSR